MFSSVKTVFSKVSNVIGLRNDGEKKQDASELGRLHSPLAYRRPVFLDLSEADEKRILDHKNRFAVVSKDSTLLPFNAGYCEVINAGKSVLNEDCAVALTVVLDSLPKDPIACLVNDSSQRNELKMETVMVSKQLARQVTSDDPKKEILHEKKVEESNQNESGDANPIDQPPHVESSSDEQFQDANTTLNIKSDDAQISEQMQTNCMVTEQSVDLKATSFNQKSSKPTNNAIRLDYFAIFDGHAGEGAALYASAVVHELLIERVREIQHLLIHEDSDNPALPECLQGRLPGEKPTPLHADSLIMGLLQDVLSLTDKHMKADQEKFPIAGGCTVVLAVFVLGRLYVAGAGDSRAVMYCTNNHKFYNFPGIASSISLEDDKKLYAYRMSHDFTPLTERRRLQYLGYLQPSLLGEHFTRLEFVRRVTNKDIGKKVLHRDYHMTGWTYKEVTEHDLRMPLISGVGRAKRLLGTIGVTRGLGDHNLVALSQLDDVPVKPFMSSVPEVNMHPLNFDHTPNDVLVMASDGLWDVMTIEMVGKHVTNTLEKLDENDPDRYCIAAKELVLSARGHLTQNGWRMADDKPASIDDITVMVIPLLAAKRQHV